MKKRIGIVGFGWIARDVHYPNYQTVADKCEITAVCDIKEAARQNAKAKTGLADEFIFSDYKEMIDSGLCDAIDICTPNYLHCEIAKYALNAGLPVSIEKPAGINVKEVKEVQDLAKEKGLPVFIGFTWRHRNALRYLKDLVSDGKLGEVHHVYIKCIKDSALWPGRRLEWRFKKEEAGTGVLCDLGSHMIDLLIWLGTDVQGLMANRGTFVKERQLVDSDEWGSVTTDDWANITLDLKNGSSATINLSRGCATCSALTQVEIYGKNGYLCFNEAKSNIISLKLVGGEMQELPIPESYGSFMHQSESFVNLLNGITDQYTSTIENGINAQIILDAAELSSDERRYVELKEIYDKLK